MAVVPPADVVEELSAIDRPARPGLTWTGPEQWHVTLRFFASVDPSRLVAALESMPAIPEVGPVVARCGPAASALSRHIWVLPVKGLEALAGSVAAATADLGPPEARPFRGHLTLARSKRPGVLSGLPAFSLSSEWVVDEVVGVRSELGPTGARHTVICRRGL